MRVIETAIERVRSEVAEILFVEFSQSANQRARFIHYGSCKGIGLVFVTSGPPMSKRRKPKRDEAGQEAEEQQSGREVPGFKSECAIEPALLHKQREAVEAGQRSQRGEEESFKDVLSFEVADFMCQNGLEFTFVELLNQCIEKDDFAKPAKAGKKGV